MFAFLSSDNETSNKKLNEIKKSDHCIDIAKVLILAFKTTNDDEVFLQGILDETLFKQENIKMEKIELQNEVLCIGELLKYVHAYQDELQRHAQELAKIENKIEEVRREKEGRCSDYSVETAVVDRDKVVISEMQGNIQMLRNCITHLQEDVKKAEKELEALLQTQGNLPSLVKE